MLPSVVRDAVMALHNEIEMHLPGMIQSIYIYGSIALDAYAEDVSDVDYIAVMRRALQASDKEALNTAHANIAVNYSNLDMMGAYITEQKLGQSFINSDSSPPFTYFNGKLYEDGTGLDLNPVTWYVLNKHGICVIGKKIDFIYRVSEEHLLSYVLSNMNTYWRSQLDRLISEQLLIARSETAEQTKQLVKAQLDEAVEWCVLGMLRQWYTIRERDITSKLGAGYYGLAHLPQRYKQVVKEAIALRTRQPIVGKETLQERMNALIELLQYIHIDTNKSYAAIL